MKFHRLLLCVDVADSVLLLRAYTGKLSHLASPPSWCNHRETCKPSYAQEAGIYPGRALMAPGERTAARTSPPYTGNQLYRNVLQLTKK